MTALLLGMLVARPVTAIAPQSNSQDYTSGPLVIKDNAIQQPTISEPVPIQPLAKRVDITKPILSPMQGVYNGRHYSKDEVQQLIKDYSEQYGINPEVPLCIAKHESGYNQLAKNKSSSAAGVFQYLTSTWRGTDEGKNGLSVFNADANVRAAIKYMASRRSTRPWEVLNKCPKLN